MISFVKLIYSISYLLGKNKTEIFFKNPKQKTDKKPTTSSVTTKINLWIKILLATSNIQPDMLFNVIGPVNSVKFYVKK